MQGLFAHTDKRNVLMFHGIGTATVPMEPGESDYWIDWPFFDDLLEHLSENPLSRLYWTFDDGNASDLEAARRMRARGLVGSFFVLVGRIGRAGYLSWDDIRALSDLGMEVGLHGRDHVDLRYTDNRQLNDEIRVARDELSEACGRPVRSFAIPFGAYDRRVWSSLSSSDFERVYTSDPGPSRLDARFVRRDAVMRWHTVEDIERTVEDKVAIPSKARRTLAPVLKRLR